MQVQDKLEERIKLAVQSLLENESLTADLDDEAAQTLLDWGISCVRRIALDTADLNDEEAEALMAPRLRAVRRLMRCVNNWLSAYSPEARESALSSIPTQATVIYGTKTVPLDEHRLKALASLSPGCGYTGSRLIAYLRKLVEPEAEGEEHPLDTAPV